MMTSDLVDIILSAVSEELRISADSIDHDIDLSNYGIDSLAGMAITVQIEDLLGLTDLDPTLLWDHPSVNRLAAVLADHPAIGVPAVAIAS